jgi:hypothetical protein
MSAQEYKTIFVTDQGSVQQAAAITKIMDGGRGGGRKYQCPPFSQ